MRRKKEMMKAPSKLTPSEVAKALPLPKVGEVIKGKKVKYVHVIDADASGSFTVGILFDKGVRRKEVPSMLMKLLNAHHITTPKGDYTVGSKDYQVKPTKDGVQVIMAMQITPAIYNNPGKGKKKEMTPLEDFDHHYEKMAIDNPEKYFRVFKAPPFNGPAFRAKLWTFVGYMGENYGYSDKDNIYHRRASLVMPQIKITKAPVGAKMMYHTHPRKDEPSLSSPDDYLLYFDLSMPPRSIRHFFTVMADRMDYFHITPKKDAKGKYVRVSEEKFIEELDAQMSVFEKKHDAKYQKGTMQDDLKFCEAITRDVVKWLNKKYKDYVTIKYKCYYKARKNPPEPEFDDLHLGDEFIAKAIQDIRDGEYSWPEFGEDKKPQENYAYWFTQYYFMEDDRDRQLQLLTLQDGRKQIQWGVKHRTRQLGLGPSRLNVINHYLDAMPHPEYSNYDMLNLLSLHYDIMSSDESIRDGTGSKSRIEDMAKEMSIPDEVRDNLLMIEEARAIGPYTEEAKTLSGDFYPLLILSNLSIEAVQIMKSVENGLMTIEQARHDVYHRKKDRALNAIDEFLLDYQRKYNQSDREVLGIQIPGRFRGAKLNPPPTVSKTEFTASIPKEDLSMIDIVIEALEKFAPYEQGGSYHVERTDMLYMIVPGGGTSVRVTLALTTGNMQIFVPAKGHPVPTDPSLAAMEAYQEVIRELNEYGLNVANEQLEVATMVTANPRGKSQVILISGASGSGKSTTIRNLLQALPKSKTVPTYTTRKKRKSDKPGEKVFITEDKFKEMEAAGEFAESVRQKNGNFYGRRFEDFKGADYVILDVSLAGYNRYKQLYPSAYGVYLETTAKPKQVYQLLLRRGQMSPQEARKRSSIIPSHIRDSKKQTFDKRIKSVVGKYDDIALEILDDIPRNNPNPYFNAHLYASGSRDPFFPGDVPVAPPDLLKNPSKKITSVRIEESPNKEKKMVAYFFDAEGKKVRTTHFGARGMSDYTQHKDPERMKRYLARHGNMGEDWKDPTTAGALSRWILWGKPGLRDSFNDYKKRFNLQGTMTVTNTRMNANRVPKKYEGQDPREHSDLFTDEDPKNTIKGLGFKDKETAERSINIIKRSGKTHAHKMQAAMAMEQRARFHAHQTPGIRAGQKVYAKFIEEMKKKTKEMRKNPTAKSCCCGATEENPCVCMLKGVMQCSAKDPKCPCYALLDERKNPSRTPEGRKIPKKYLKGLNRVEMAIAAKEIDKGYKYDSDDPKAYEDWKSDIKAKARGYKTVPSKYKKKFIEMYGPLPEKGEFLDKMAKATKIKKSILQEVYKKGLAAWATGHRVGVAPHQWATGRVYSFVTLGNTVKKGNKKMPDYSLAVKAGLVKKNPSRDKLPFRPTSDCFLLYNGKLVAQDMGHYIAFPGGGVDEGEKPIEAATRELMEEVGAILKEPLKPLGEITWVWNPEWADTPKRQKRYQQFQGERVYFFTGEVDRFVKATSDEGDAWVGSKLMKIQDAIDYLENKKDNLEYPNQKKYIEYQIACLEELNTRNNPSVPFGPRPNPNPDSEWRHGKAMSEEKDPFASMFVS